MVPLSWPVSNLLAVANTEEASVPLLVGCIFHCFYGQT